MEAGRQETPQTKSLNHLGPTRGSTFLNLNDSQDEQKLIEGGWP